MADSSKKLRSYSLKEKLEIVEFAKANDNSKAHRKFKVDQKCIRQWRNAEADLRDALMNGGECRKRLKGGGRKKVAVLDVS
jgi:hypothetical protein